MSDQNRESLSPAILEIIGSIATQWSAIEAQMDIAILRIQEIDLSTGMVVTSELGFRARHNILMTIVNEPGGIEPETEAKALKDILRRIDDAYPKRNSVVHQLWVATGDPNIASRMGIRTKGRLKTISESVSVADLSNDAEEIYQIGADLLDFMERNNLVPEGGLKILP